MDTDKSQQRFSENYSEVTVSSSAGKNASFEILMKNIYNLVIWRMFLSKATFKCKLE